MRRKILKLYGWILAIGLLYRIWILLTDLQIPCIYLLTTGLKCPGCGTTRMLLALLRLDPGAAFAYNPVVLVLFFMWNLIALLCFTEKIRFVQKPRFLYGSLAISITTLIVYGVIRNFS